MNLERWLGISLWGILLATLAGGCVCSWAVPFSHCLQAPYSDPPSSLQPADLAGTWQTSYERGVVDKLMLRADGTFKQLYETRVAHIIRDYAYETGWNEWEMERFADGRVRIRLRGARYYLGGIRMAELDGKHFGGAQLWGEGGAPSYGFYDPIADETVHMVGELVLNVRVDSSGEFLLHHMWTSHDRGFAMSGCERSQFRRVEIP
ncbi:MAG: hypothetical protein GTO63_00730 [Anaerolineae bacterium]|nr:hypothetical protein [Anaerolineae bacterium]NIN93533.1 hypothetical protein [Anaerolineae bacterium]NIQ76602.1 hypothetical protein [Anaerolineae bacterium]